ncbi:hypothetical protein NECAME_10865 [Necator americanus]|uniref:Uncharacterized protein n=1 Tax=Necator americanus TaxID=51031 RepID=W2T6T2_NECAM|nr:hypothetical protein NECAME_10865 [Necator americanus]ETN77715.1 hypothetical protein NECAME_10865 [Necator americanus]
MAIANAPTNLAPRQCLLRIVTHTHLDYEPVHPILQHGHQVLLERVKLAACRRPVATSGDNDNAIGS